MNIVEREGVSYRHDARFILVGSMNPEEGGLRPQFLDRFGLYVEVRGEEDIRKRAEITRRRVEYEKAPAAFLEKWRGESDKLALAIRQAAELLPRVTVTDNAMALAASIARESNCAGHRAELVISETAKAIAAYDGRTVLNIADIKEAAKFALPHRARQAQQEPPGRQDPTEGHPDEDPDQGEQEPPEHAPDNGGREEEPGGNRQPPPDDPADPAEQPPERSEDTEDNTADQLPRPGERPETVFAPGESFMVSKWLTENRDVLVKRGSGRRSLVTTGSLQGRYVRYTFPKGKDLRDIAIDATLRAAAPYQKTRAANGMAVVIDKSDIRVKIRERRTGNTIVFVVDASGSMGANRQMTAVKGAIVSILNDAYQKRDKVSLIAFRKNTAELLLGITRSVELAEKKLAVLPTGGVTPLAAGLDMAFEVVKAARIKDKDILPVIVLVTDGRATYSDRSKDAFGDALRAASRIGAEKIKSVVIDTDRNFIRLNLAEKLAAAMGADRFQIEDIRAQTVVAAVALSL